MQEQQLIDIPNLIHSDISIDFTPMWTESLGDGQSGHVRPVICNTSGQHFALKIVPDTPQSRFEIASHIRLASQCDHIIQIKAVYLNQHRKSVNDVMSSHLFIVMEKACMDGFTLLTSRSVLPENIIRNIARCLVMAIKHMHDQNIAHRDIKLENFLLMNHCASEIRLADFGFAMQCGQTPVKYQCTPAYVSPEVLRAKHDGYHHPAHRASDMWSLGVTLFALFAGKYPFGNGKNVDEQNKILGGNFVFQPQRWTGVSEQAKRVIRSLLTVNADRRMTVDELLSDEWLQ